MDNGEVEYAAVLEMLLDVLTLFSGNVSPLESSFKPTKVKCDIQR